MFVYPKLDFIINYCHPMINCWCWQNLVKILSYQILVLCSFARGRGGGGREGVDVDVYIFFPGMDAANPLSLINVIRGGGNFRVWYCVFIIFPA